MAEHLLGVLASGGGSNSRAIYNATRDGRLPNTRIAVVLSDNADAGVLELAKHREIPAYFLGSKITNEQRNQTIADAFRTRGVELGIGAGYLKLVGGAVLKAYPNEMLNIHPGPLPKFGGPGMHGEHVHQAVIDSGIKWSGPTVHIMNENYDEGQILAHVQVPVLEGDTAHALAERILPYEHNLYWRVIAQQLQRGVSLAEQGINPVRD